MKKILLLLMLFIGINAFSQIVQNPEYEKRNADNVKILSVELSPSQTVVKFSCTQKENSLGYYVFTEKNSYIEDIQTGEKYFMQKSIDMPISPKRYSFDQNSKGVLYYTQIFNPLPNSTKKINIVEKISSSSAFNFYGVDISEAQKGRSVATKASDEEKYEYFPSGLIKSHVKYVKDKMDGIYTEFSEDGKSCYQLRYKNGKAEDYCTISESEGYSTRYSLADKTPIWVAPTKADMKENEVKVKSKEEKWTYYTVNNMIVAVSTAPVNYDSKYTQVTVLIANNSVEPIILDTNSIKMNVITENGSKKTINAMDYKEYFKKVNKKEKQSTWLLGFWDAYMDGNSYSSESMYSSSAAKYFKGSADKFFNKKTEQEKSREKEFLGSAFNQKEVIDADKIISYNDEKLTGRVVSRVCFQWITNIYPGKVVYGQMYFDVAKSKAQNVAVTINDIEYTFPVK